MSINFPRHFNQQQLTVLEAEGIAPDLIISILDSLDKALPVEMHRLKIVAIAVNALYRSGWPIISDYDYDTYIHAPLLAEGDAFTQTVEDEPEEAFEGELVELSQIMLSTDKAYSIEDVRAWAARIEKAAAELKLSIFDVVIRVTPKLDGYAALDDGKTLATRGNGYRGTDITRVFDRGLPIQGEARGQGPGEIVIDREYFEAFLSTQFDNTRNVQASVIKEGEHLPVITQAIEDGAVVFFPFSQLPEWRCTVAELLARFDEIVDKMWQSVPYDVDGVVIEAPQLRDIMGYTSHHHRNTIAFKRNDPPVEVKVMSVTFQTGKTGRVTPVAELDPTLISGAVLTRATLYNVGWAEKRQIGDGSVVQVVRAGLVIPKVVGVIKPGKLSLPESCPSCDEPLRRSGDNLWCDNKSTCSAQVGNTLEHFFKTIGSCDGFGPKTIQKLIEAGHTTVEAIFQLNEDDYLEMGFGDKTAKNLIAELSRCRATPVEDWRFLAAFSLTNVGRDGAEKLLSTYPLRSIFTLTLEDILSIKGFAEKKSQFMFDALQLRRNSIEALLAMGFNLIETPIGEVDVESTIAGKTIVFTGTMLKGARKDMEKQAKSLGAKVSGSVTGNTDILVVGEKVGANKMNAAKANSTQILTEDEYLALINS